jgi:hypothetical protein
VANQNFPKAQTATFSAISLPHKFHQADLQIAQAVFDVTASGDSNKILINGIPVVGVNAQGSVYTAGYGKAQASTLTLGTVQIKPAEWTVGKRFELFDVTGSDDTEKGWEWGWPVVYGSVRGWVIAGGPIFDTESVALSAVFDVFGTIAGTAKIRNLRVGTAFRRGGPLPISFQWQATGGWTHTSPIDPEFSTAEMDPMAGDLELDMDTGETVTHKALLYNFTVRAPAVTGGPLPITAQFRFDAAEEA